MKVEINSYEKKIKMFVSNTDAMELLDMLDKFDADEWDGYDIVIDGYEKEITYPVIINTPRYSPPIWTVDPYYVYSPPIWTVAPYYVYPNTLISTTSKVVTTNTLNSSCLIDTTTSTLTV